MAVVAVCLILLTWLSGTPAPIFIARAQVGASDTCPGNLLAGGDMERGFANRTLGDDLLANGWLLWFDPAPNGAAPHFGPAGRTPDGAAAVHGGLRSQEMAGGAPAQAGGLFQRAVVPPGSVVQATAWVWSMAATSAALAASDRPGEYAVSIGLDPAAGEDAGAASVFWTSPITITDVWLPIRIEQAIDAEELTLFLKGQPLGDLPGSRSRWDDVCLRVVGKAGEPLPTGTPPPRPSATRRPGAPTNTPSVATLEAMATALIDDATATADALLAATAEAGARTAVRATAQAISERRAAATAAAARQMSIPIGPWLADRLGIAAAALALIALGLLIGFDAQRKGR